MRKGISIIVLLTLALGMSAASSIFGAGALDMIYSMGGGLWACEQMNTNIYTALTRDTTQAFNLYGARAGGGLDYIYRDVSSWGTEQMNTNTYTCLTNDATQGWNLYGARAGGGLDYLYRDFVGGNLVWMTQQMNTNTYTALTNDITQAFNLYGARADGGLDYLYRDFVGGNLVWMAQQMNTNTYTAIAHDATQAFNLYGARAGGGLDYIYRDFVGGNLVWMAQQVNANTYTALVGDRTMAFNFYGARAGGGLDRLYRDYDVDGNLVWVTQQLSANTYTAITNDSTQGWQVHGARAGGGLDTFYWIGDSAWANEQLNTNTYRALIRDAKQGLQFYGAQATLEPSMLQECKSLDDGTAVMVSDITVVAKFVDAIGPIGFAVEDTDRTSGIRVISTTAVNTGDIVTINGTATTVNGERVIDASSGSVSIASSGNPVIRPLGVGNLRSGGGNLGKQVAVVDVAPDKMSIGLNNVGMLVKIWGNVTYVSNTGGYDGYFYVDDGSGLQDGSGRAGIRCRPAAGVSLPTSGYVSVTGVMGVQKINGVNARYFWTTSWQ